jgi:hypothetical protein
MNVNLFEPTYQAFFDKFRSLLDNQDTQQQQEQQILQYAAQTKNNCVEFYDFLDRIITYCGFNGLNPLNQGLTFRLCSFLTVLFLAQNTVTDNRPMTSNSVNCTFSILTTPTGNLYSKTVSYIDIINSRLDNVIIDNTNGRILNLVSQNDPEFQNHVMNFVDGFATYALPQNNNRTIWDLHSFLQNNNVNPLIAVSAGIRKYNVSTWSALDGFSFNDCFASDPALFRICLGHEMFTNFLRFLCKMGIRYQMLHNDLHSGNAYIVRDVNGNYKIVMIDYGRLTCSSHISAQTDEVYKLEIIRNGQPFPPTSNNVQCPTYQSILEANDRIFINGVRPLILLDIATYFTNIYKYYYIQLGRNGVGSVDQESLRIFGLINTRFCTFQNAQLIVIPTTLDGIFLEYNNLQDIPPNYIAIFEGLFLMSLLLFYLHSTNNLNHIYAGGYQYIGTQNDAVQFSGWLTALIENLRNSNNPLFNDIIRKSLYISSLIGFQVTQVNQFTQQVPCQSNGVQTELQVAFGQTKRQSKNKLYPLSPRTRSPRNLKKMQSSGDFAKLFLFGPKNVDPNVDPLAAWGKSKTIGVPVINSGDWSGFQDRFNYNEEMKKGCDEARRKLKESQNKK